MKILIAVASRHAATDGIAQVIALELSELGFCDVVLQPVGEVGSLEGYRAVVLGSAVYAGRWLKDARAFLERNHEQLAAMPVWLFSSGPLGDPPVPDAPPAELTAAAEEIGARDHRVFAGALDRAQLSLAERTIARAVHAPEGDYRDWDAIRDWAATIAAALQDLGVAPFGKKTP